MSLPSLTLSSYPVIMHLINLYEKIADFENRLSPEIKEFSHCRKECSRCCYTDISVFEIEASNIQRWFHALTIEEKTNLMRKWETPLSEKENFQMQKVRSCAFLHEESCTIYEARPLICRTQGLALKYKEEENIYLDICPLNEELLFKLSSSESLNLDLMNAILSQLENLDSETTERKRRSLSDLRNQLWMDLQNS